MATRTASTFGENQLASLISQLPKDEYFAVAQPKLIAWDGQGWTPDFVIVAAHLGVVAVEVKDWQSITEANQETVTIRTSDGESLRLSNPVNTARHYAEVLASQCQKRQELLAPYRDMMKLVFPWQYAVALPYLSPKVVAQIELAAVWERGVAFSRDDLKSPDALDQALRRLPWRFRMDRPMNNDTLDTIRGVLCPSVRIFDPDGLDVGTETHIQTRLIQEPLPAPQLPGLADDDGYQIRLVRGVSGSGKTLVLVRRALALKERYPDARILVLSFNRDLSADLARRIGREGVDVMDFHQLCTRIINQGWLGIRKPETWLKRRKKILKKNNLTIDFVADEIGWRKDMDLYDNDAYLVFPRVGRGSGLTVDKRRVINDLFNGYRDYQRTLQDKGKSWADWEDTPNLALEAMNADWRDRFDAVLIDEAQDFAPVWFEVIKAVLKPQGALFICDDPTQSIFRNYSWKQKGIEVAGRTRILKIPFRNTRQITLAAHALIQADANLKHDEEITAPNLRSYNLVDGPLPDLQHCTDAGIEVRIIEEHIALMRDAGIPAHSIAVICPDNDIRKDYDHLRDEAIYVDVFNRMKGLEFQAVFIPQVQSLFIYDEDGYTFTHQRRRLFTAMTRARRTLVLTYTGELSAELDALLPYVRHLDAQHPGTGSTTNIAKASVAGQ